MSLQDKKTTMQIIREGLKMKHVPGHDDSKEFINAIYGLMDEYAEFYRPEFDRIDDNEDVYRGKHWERSPYQTKQDVDPNMPKPSIPIINATIENLKSDMVRDCPEAILSPDWSGMAISAKILTRVCNQDQKERHFIKDWVNLIHDLYVGGYCVFEANYDPDMCNGHGMSYVGYQPIKNMMFDPCAPNIQNGRGHFKVTRRPFDYYLQRFPEQAQYMTEDLDVPQEIARSKDSSVPQDNSDQLREVEFWVRVWDTKAERYRVHMVQLAGHQILYMSTEHRPTGYYNHGKYPFVVRPLFSRPGTPLGYGIVDIFKDAQRYSDKLSQIILMNAYMSGDNKILIGEGSGLTVEDMADWSKRVIKGQAIGDSFVRWMQPNALPSYVFNYSRMMMQDIKTESGSNDQSRGQSGNSITAASAITALQEAATKRSRMESLLMQDAYAEAIEMKLELQREFDEVPRKVPVTIGGHVYVFYYDKTKIIPVSVDNVPIEGPAYDSLVKIVNEENVDKEKPIGYYVDVKTAVQTIYQKMQTNEVIFSTMQKLQGSADVAILMESLQIDEIEEIMDTVRRAQQGGITNLTNQLQGAVQKIQELQERVAIADQTAAKATQTAQSAQATAQTQQQLQQKRAAAQAIPDPRQPQQPQ